MAAVREPIALDEAVMLTPRSGPGVCSTCFNLVSEYERCYACAHGGRELAAMLPISYSVGHEQLHRALASYKRAGRRVSHRLGVELAALLWRFLDRHEECLAQAAGTGGFELVTTVPSSDRERDEEHPLRWIVGELVGPTRGRYDRLLYRTGTDVDGRTFDVRKFATSRPLAGEPVLLIDDTWTTGANAQSAAAALRAGGSGPVAALVIGRHVNRDWGDIDSRLRELPPFDWQTCALCASPTQATPP